MLTCVHGYGDGVGERGASRHGHIDWYGIVGTSFGIPDRHDMTKVSWSS